MVAAEVGIIFSHREYMPEKEKRQDTFSNLILMRLVIWN